ncbi:MAG: response regulator, partial [Chloroflexota bacterium]
SPLGFGVRLAPSGEDGLALAAQVRPDLIICDLLMPGLDGFAVVSRLQADATTAAIPILIVTAHELTEPEKARLNGRVLGIVEKGDLAAQGLRDWLDRVIPDILGRESP